MKKLLSLALLTILTLHSSIKTEADLYAISYTGSIEDLANMDNPLENDDLDKFLKNIPGGKLGVLGTRKLYLHTKNTVKVVFSVTSFVLASSYISSDNTNEAYVNKKWHENCTWTYKTGRFKTGTSSSTGPCGDTIEKKVLYQKALITSTKASKNKLNMIPSQLYDQLTFKQNVLTPITNSTNNTLYIKITQKASPTHVDGGGSTTFSSTNAMPLGLQGSTGIGLDANDLYIPIYASTE